MKTYFLNEAVSRSTLVKFKTSSRTGASLMDKKESESQAMTFGRAFHKMMESEDLFLDAYYIMPDDAAKIEEIGGSSPRATKLYKEWKQNHIDEANGKDIITVQELNDITKMVENIKKTSFFNSFDNGKVSYEAEFSTELNGLKMKCMADVLIERKDFNIVVDWKTTRANLTNEERDIRREIIKYDLHIQDAHYRKVIEKATGKPVLFYFGFVENHTGFDFVPVMIDPKSDLRALADIQWSRCVANYKDYLNGKIVGVSDEFENSILIIE